MSDNMTNPVSQNPMDLVVYYWEYDEPEAQMEMGTAIAQQKQAFARYKGQQKRVIAEYMERHDRKHKELKEFKKAVQHAKQAGATLIIPQLQNLTRFESFTKPLLDSDVDFYCLDQPRVNNMTLAAVVENIRFLREKHSRLISEGLARTMAQLGNPNALQEITKVNKPKTESAVLFALILSPIIAYYRMQGYSQRRMAQTLNDEGFSAPEGGHWVLSQLQKVLDRVDMNDVALALCTTLDEFEEKGYNNAQCAKALTAMRAKSPGRKPWDDYLVGKIKERLQTIREIAGFNEFVVLVYPHMQKFQESGLSDEEIAKRLNQDGVQIPERVIWELEHENEEAVTTLNREQWEAHDVEIARRIAERRKADISHYVHPHTLQRSEVLFKEFTGIDIEQKAKELGEKVKEKESDTKSES
jgi:hypothetical protein